MTTLKSFDWSILDRSLLVEMLAISTGSFVGKSFTPSALTKRIRDQFNFFVVPIKVTTVKHYDTEKNAVWVGGLYDSIADKKKQKFITIRLQYNPDIKKITITRNLFARIVKGIADTILHEIIHMRQYRRRKFKDIPGYTSTAALSKQRKEQDYLGHNDEIDAYAFNIACYLSDKFDNNNEQIVYYLNSSLKDKRIKKDAYKMYLNAFDHNHSHTVIKKLKKKIIYYLPYTRLGKQYKTSDLLK